MCNMLLLNGKKSIWYIVEVVVPLGRAGAPVEFVKN